MPLASLYRLIRTASGALRIHLGAVTGLVIPLAAVPLELQRRIVNEVLEAGQQGRWRCWPASTSSCCSRRAGRNIC